MMRYVVIAFTAVCLLSSPALAERGTRAERYERAVQGMENALEQKQMLKENEAFANAHPAEAKRCFDPMMAVADEHGVERGKYFADNQQYFRDCIEQQLGAMK